MSLDREPTDLPDFFRTFDYGRIEDKIFASYPAFYWHMNPSNDQGEMKLAMGNTVVLYSVYTPSYGNLAYKASSSAAAPKETAFVLEEFKGGILVDSADTAESIVNKIAEFKSLSKRGCCIVHLTTGTHIGFFRIEETSQVSLMQLNKTAS